MSPMGIQDIVTFVSKVWLHLDPTRCNLVDYNLKDIIQIKNAIIIVKQIYKVSVSIVTYIFQKY